MNHVERLAIERAMLHALMCVVRLMDGGDRVTDTLVFRASMPSLGALFKDDENTLTLEEAVKRLLEIVEAE